MSSTSNNTPQSSGLIVFTFVWSHVAALQLAKAWHLTKRFGGLLNLILTLGLFLSIIYSNFQCHKPFTLLLLVFFHSLSLIFQGSQSNHVIAATTVTLIILFSYNRNRETWQRNISGGFYLFLIIIYIIPLVHKLNLDYLDPTVSCATLFSAGLISSFIPEKFLRSSQPNSLPRMAIDFFLRSAPLQGIFVESIVPVLLVLWRISKKPTDSTIYFKILVVIAAVFHLIVALPLPPMSAYPFSCLMAPVYILILPRKCTDTLLAFIQNVWPFGLVTAVTTGLVSVSVKAILQDEPMPLEYPPYGLWLYGATWNIIVWSAVIAVTLFVNYNNENEDMKDNKPQSPFPRFHFKTQGLLVLLGLVVIGWSPYLGIRNYPALAMFSNLRTEGNRPNDFARLVLPPMQILDHLTDTVTIQDTNIQALRYYQINLGNYFTKHVRAFNDHLGISNEFWITPPYSSAWTATAVDASSSFKPYSIPTVELQKVISTLQFPHINNETDIQYVKYTRENPQQKSDSKRILYFATNRPCLSLVDSYEIETCKVLTKPVSWIARVAFKFRSFDSDYSPCRH